jgi:outer membrane receptor protein involved in Fe transport
MRFSIRWSIPPLALGLAAAGLEAQTAPQPTAVVEVTATRFPEDPAKVPASITVITGQELLDRGATDLRSALALCAGITIAPGGDSGPASSIPELWGLREFDAFLLVVDGVPWGGTFNPALTTLDLENVERIEVQRGAAPVMYGATSFVGVIQVIHRAAADTVNSARLWAGNHGSGGASATLRLPAWSGLESTLTLDVGKLGFADPRTSIDRGTLAWRARTDLGGGSLRCDLSGAWIDTKPGSPIPQLGTGLNPDVPKDTNQNPAGAFVIDRRLALALGYDHSAGSAIWSTLLAFSQARQGVFRGFLVDGTTTSPDAHGWREQVDTTDLYVDTHLAWSGAGMWKVVLGVDHLHGQGIGRGGDFDYDIALDGSNPPASATLPPAAAIRIDDQRDFSGLYGFAEWEPLDRFLVEGGLRFNHTVESRRAFTLDFGSGSLDGGSDEKTFNKCSGSLGFTWSFWKDGKDRLAFFGDYRTTFKPSAIDFGLDSQAPILEPEAAQSHELGLKGTLLDGRVNAEVAAFRMDFKNLVVTNNAVLINGGKERFQGLEASVAYRWTSDLYLRAAYSHHDSRFTDSIQDAGDPSVPTQLAGHRLEMTPYQLVGFGVLYAPRRGFVGTLETNYNGGYYLDKENTALQGGYVTLAASAGWRGEGWELRLGGQNLTDRRVPVAASELGDGQYYLLPARQVNASVRFRF